MGKGRDRLALVGPFGRSELFISLPDGFDDVVREMDKEERYLKAYGVTTSALQHVQPRVEWGFWIESRVSSPSCVFTPLLFFLVVHEHMSSAWLLQLAAAEYTATNSSSGLTNGRSG